MIIRLLAFNEISLAVLRKGVPGSCVTFANNLSLHHEYSNSISCGKLKMHNSRWEKDSTTPLKEYLVGNRKLKGNYKMFNQMLRSESKHQRKAKMYN